MSRRVHILGGGPAGLAAGYFAHDAGLDVRLFEANDAVGGNARTIVRDGFSFDTGAHRFHAKDPFVTDLVQRLIGDDLLEVDAPSAIYDDGKLIDFPLRVDDLLRHSGPLLPFAYLWGFLKARIRPLPAEPSFEDLSRRRFGDRLAERYLLNYSRKLWGWPTDNLSPSISGGRLRGLHLAHAIRRTMRMRSHDRRDIDGRFLYPRRGIGMISDALAAALPSGSIQLGSRVTRIHHDGGRIRSIEINGGRAVAVESVIGTLPLTLMLRLLHPAPPEEISELVDALAFRSIRLLMIGLDRPRLTPHASIYFPDEAIRFTRLYESSNRSRAMAPAGQSAIALELPCSRGDEGDVLSDEDLMAEGLRLLELFGVTAGEVRHLSTLRLPNAYPILRRGIERSVSAGLDYLDGFTNLHLLGRTQLFRYSHLHDHIRDAERLVGQLANLLHTSVDTGVITLSEPMRDAA